MDKVKVGFVGSGFMGQVAHIANYARLPDVELVALAEGRQRTAEAVAEKYGVREIYASHRELLEKAKVDAVVSVMGFHLTASVARDVLAAKKNCLTEKPICIKADTARELVALADAQGVLYQIGYMKRFDPASRIGRKSLEAWRQGGAYGNLKYLRVMMPPGDWIFGMDPPIDMKDAPVTYESVEVEKSPSWMSPETAERYIAFINYYIHQINMIRFLLGEDFEVEYADRTGVVLILRSASGVPITLEMAPYESKGEWRETYLATFERGWIEISLPAPLARQRSGRVRTYREEPDGGVYEEPVIPPHWSMQLQAKSFIESVKLGTPSLSPASDGVKDLEVAEAYIRLLVESGRANR